MCACVHRVTEVVGTNLTSARLPLSSPPPPCLPPPPPGFYFFLAMFFTPIISSIPPYATGPALILVGSLMMENLLDIDWKDYTQAIPAFITISVIPLTYSIA